MDALLLSKDDLKKYHTATQAMKDFLAIAIDYQERLGCSKDKTSNHYCPVISVGGSYPGFLSAVLRLHYPDVIDISYASSAPLLLYSMDANQFGYMEKVTDVTDIASPGHKAAQRPGNGCAINAPNERKYSWLISRACFLLCSDERVSRRCYERNCSETP